jgi:hypothetical protein
MNICVGFDIGKSKDESLRKLAGRHIGLLISNEESDLLAKIMKLLPKDISEKITITQAVADDITYDPAKTLSENKIKKGSIVTLSVLPKQV